MESSLLLSNALNGKNGRVFFNLNQPLDADMKNETENEKLFSYLLLKFQRFLEISYYDACFRIAK